MVSEDKKKKRKERKGKDDHQTKLIWCEASGLTHGSSGGLRTTAWSTAPSLASSAAGLDLGGCLPELCGSLGLRPPLRKSALEGDALGTQYLISESVAVSRSGLQQGRKDVPSGFT